jgi:hypothetical protein
MAYDFSSLDFDTLKAELRRYMEADATFADYNFDGSALNSIINLLTYVTLQQNFYLNMTTQELYLDTATLFRNATAIAKSLNYLPYRMQPALITSDMQFIDSDELITIPQYCKFLVDGVPFTTKTAFNFTNDEIIEDVPLYQMEIVDETYSYSNLAYELLHGVNIADDYVIVKVNGEVWTEYNPSNVIDYSSKVYFLSFNNNDKLTVSFGDGTFGQNPTTGSTIEVTYGVTLGVDGNGLEDIVLNQVLPTEYELTFSNSIISYGGADSETLESIKLNAPRFYEAQNRIVTKSDYIVFIEGHAPSDVDLVSVWGGEENDPPIYGTVFISIKPNTPLTPEQIASRNTVLLDYLSDYTVITIRNEIIEPTYIYCDLDSTVYYYKDYGISTSDLEVTIEENIQNYFDNDLNSFDTKLKYSNLVAAIDAPNAVSNNLTDITYSLRFDQSPNNQYDFDVQNAITEGSLVNPIIEDSEGIIKLKSNGIAVGTIDYVNGTMSFNVDFGGDGNILYFKTNLDDFNFRDTNLPYYNQTTITFEGI